MTQKRWVTKSVIVLAWLWVCAGLQPLFAQYDFQQGLFEPPPPLSSLNASTQLPQYDSTPSLPPYNAINPLMLGEAPISVPSLEGDSALSPVNATIRSDAIPDAMNVATPTISSSDAGPTIQWYYPWTWIPLDGWVNSVEVGINGTDGNSESFSFQTGARFKRKTERHLFEWRTTHAQTQSNGTKTQNNALMYFDHERFIQDSPWSWFNKLGLEYDQFKAFDLRLNMNTGIGYRWVDTKDLRLATRFGAGASREFGGPADEWVPEAVFGGDYDHQINKRNKVVVKVDYFPEWTNFNHFRLVSDLAWEYLLDEKGNLSIKLGANDRYDSTPNGRKPNDVNYSLLLLYKF